MGRYEDAIETYNMAFAKDSDSPAMTQQQAFSSCRSHSRGGSPDSQFRRVPSKKRMLDEPPKSAFRLHPIELIMDED